MYSWHIYKSTRFLAIEERENEVEDEEEEEGTPASRFTDFLLHALQQAFHAKDKNVRYRVLFTLLQMIAHLGAIEYAWLLLPIV